MRPPFSQLRLQLLGGFLPAGNTHSSLKLAYFSKLLFLALNKTNEGVHNELAKTEGFYEKYSKTTTRYGYCRR